jgi:hypothetical protein
MKVFMLAVLAAGLAIAQKVTVEFDQSADFQRYHTFALRDGQLNSRYPALNSDLVKKNLDNSIIHYLAAKGLTEVTGRADLNVRYHFGSARRTEVERYPAGWRGLGTRAVRVPYTEGTLVIDLRDAGMHLLVWRSIAYEDNGDPDRIARKLDDMVKKSIGKYPPKPGAAR